MTQAKSKIHQKPDLEIKTRKPKKKDADIFGNLGNSKKSSVPEVHPIAEMLNDMQPIQDNPPNPLNPQQPTAPIRNFSKVANSVTNAITEKMFKGLSKQTYDVLYSKTRGAIKPSRTVTITKNNLEKLTGYSGNTLSKHLTHLKNTGLVKIDLNLGQHKGSTYEVLLPEELTQPNPTHATHATPTNPTQKVVPNPTQKVGLDGYSKPEENKDTYEIPKTFFKDYKHIDDETLAAFMKMINKFSEASEKLTGKKPTKFEVDTWERLADLLIGELLKANDKTGAVSNIPAFLTEVLRRKLLNSKTQSNSKSFKTKSDPGKNVYNPDDREDISQEELEETLIIFLRNLREEEGFKNMIYGQEQIYSKSDWKWLMDELKKEGFEPPTQTE